MPERGSNNLRRMSGAPHVARCVMERKSGIFLYLEALVVWVYTFLGTLVLLAGLALLLYQAYFWVTYGIWGQMPASSLFIESRVPIDRLPVLDDAKDARLPSELLMLVRERVVYERLYSVVPNRLRSNTSWLAKPQYLHGLHNIVVRILEFLSISGMLFLVGAFCIGITLSAPKNETDEERHEPAL